MKLITKLSFIVSVLIFSSSLYAETPSARIVCSGETKIHTNMGYLVAKFAHVDQEISEVGNYTATGKGVQDPLNFSKNLTFIIEIELLKSGDVQFKITIEDPDYNDFAEAEGLNFAKAVVKTPGEKYLSKIECINASKDDSNENL